MTSSEVPMATVAVVTRTKDRPLMLRRAMESVSAQSFDDFVWVVVNDGGDPGEVEEIAEVARGRMMKVVVLHHAVNKGMEAASNAGIAATSSDFVVIHDDDDTWHRDFLAVTVPLLARPGPLAPVGVVTGTVRVDEIVRGGAIRITNRRPWKPGAVGYPIGMVHIADVAAENSFPPIAFLFRRDAYERAGGYDETLPVLGDWDFNLRMLLIGDVLAIPDRLANYHHRPASKGTAYGNSVVDGLNKHVVYDAFVRNRAIRTGTSDGACLLGQALLAGRNRLAAQRHRRLKRVLAYLKASAYRALHLLRPQT